MEAIWFNANANGCAIGTTSVLMTQLDSHLSQDSLLRVAGHTGKVVSPSCAELKDAIVGRSVHQFVITFATLIDHRHDPKVARGFGHSCTELDSRGSSHLTA